MQTASKSRHQRVGVTMLGHQDRKHHMHALLCDTGKVPFKPASIARNKNKHGEDRVNFCQLQGSLFRNALVDVEGVWVRFAVLTL